MVPRMAELERCVGLLGEEAMAEKFDGLLLVKAAGLGRAGVGETLAYMVSPRENWTRQRTNNMLERLMWKVRQRTRVVGAFPDVDSPVMLVAARLRHVAATE